jgi:CubicO group peptidase (beta-lactamase class C family)
MISAVSVRRRALLGAGLAGAVAAVGGCGESARSVWAEPAARPSSEASGAGAQVAAHPPLTPASKAGAAPDSPLTFHVRSVLTKYLKPTPDNPKHPGYAGAVALLTVDGKTTVNVAVGDAVRYKAGPVELPVGQRVPMRTDAIFDLASLTKIYTAILVLRLADAGQIDLAAPVQRYLPQFAGTGKGACTVAMMLAHTSGLPVGPTFTGLTDNIQRWGSVMNTPLVKGQTPGRTFRYSSVGLMVLGRLVELFAANTLDQVVRDQLTTPLGLRDTGFRPLKWADKNRLVATDARTSRGLLRGTVHDDVANALGGVAGHAGMFGTAADVAVIGQMMLNGGTYQGRRILSADIVRTALTNANAGKPAVDPDRPHRTSTHGLGFELNQSWFMGNLAGPQTFGHTGFTGTSLLVEPKRKLVLVLLTNRAHPNWTWSNPDTHRVAVANEVAAGL